MILTTLIQAFDLLIRFAQISEKLIIPTKQVNANKQKQNVIKNATIGCNPSNGVKDLAEARNFGKRSIAIKASASAANSSGDI